MTLQLEASQIFFMDTFHWRLDLSEREKLCSKLVEKAIDAIASCEHFDEVLSAWQVKILF